MARQDKVCWRILIIQIYNFNKNTYFLSGKVLISEGQKYSCLEAKKQKNVLTGEPEIVYDTKDFWKELDHYRLFNNI